MQDFLTDIQREPHASVHAVIGNTFGCDKFYPMLEKGLIEDIASMQNLCRVWSYYMKDLYRGNYLSPKTNCDNTDFDNDPNANDCGYVCNYSHSVNLTLAVKELVSKYISRGGVKTINDDQIRAWEEFICTGDGYKILVGTHMESVSSADPSFWPIHPTQERLLHVHMISQNFVSYSWPEYGANSYICDNAACVSESDNNDSNDNSKGYYKVCCYGHFGSSQLLDHINGDADQYIGDTNNAIIESSNANSDEYTMPYIYDSFAWTHCKSVGVDLDATIEDTYNSKVAAIASATAKKQQ